MKKKFLFALLFAVAAVVTGCKDPLDEFSARQPIVAAGGDFEIKMNLAPATKTSVGEEMFDEGTGIVYMSVSFAVGDAINLFHAEYNNEGAYSSYVNDGQFVVTEVNEGVATLKGYIGADLNPEGKYDWFGVYPYSEETVSPERACIKFPSKVKMDVESPASTLAGTDCPLAGFAKNVKASDVPNIQMRQIASVVGVQVNNISDDDLVVNSIELEATQEALSGTYSLDFHLYQQYNDDMITFDSALYDLCDQPYRYALTATEDSGKKVTLDAGGYVVEAGDQCVFYIPVAPATFTRLGSGMSIRVNDLYKPSTMKSLKQYYVSFDKGYYFMNVRHKFESGKINTFSFNYAFSDIESYPSIWKAQYNEDTGKGITPASWFKNGHDIVACMACNNTVKASIEEDAFSQFSYIWMKSEGYVGPSTGARPGCVGMWEDEGFVLVVPVQQLSAGRKVIVETALGFSKTGMMTHESGDTSKPQVWGCGGPAYFRHEYSTDCGKTWKAAEIESEFKYSGNACDANVCNLKTSGEGGNYVKGICPVPSGLNHGTFLYRMRCVNASFSISDVAEGKTVGSRLGDNAFDHYGETSTYAGSSGFCFIHPDDPEWDKVFAKVSVID